jgi:hypothetical protein
MANGRVLSDLRNVALHSMLLSRQRPLLVDQSPLDSQMSKRKTARASKHDPAKMATKAQRAAQVVIRSPKDRVRDAGSTEPTLKREKDSQRDALLVKDPELLVEKPETDLQDHSKHIPDNILEKGTDVSLANANVRLYQSKLMEMAQANMQFAFEFSQRLATIKSPVEFPSVIAEFTSKRITIPETFDRAG